MTQLCKASAERWLCGCALVLLALLVGCRNDFTVWKENARAAGGAWIATARTEQWGGLGSAWVETTVSITRLDGTVNDGKAFDIFSFPGGGPIPKSYALSDENADRDLEMVWLTPTHLQIVHRTRVNPDLEVVKFSEVEISYQIHP